MLFSRPYFSRKSFFKFLIFFGLFCGLGGFFPAEAQNTSTSSQCKEPLNYYERNAFIVKAIKIEHMVKFLPKAPVLDQALDTAINKLSPETGLKIDQPFNEEKFSNLRIALLDEVEPLLIGKTGFQAISQKLKNCNSNSTPPTLEVVYILITTARNAYVSNNFELSERDDKENIETGNDKISEQNLTQNFYVGYNKSRGIYGGTKAFYKIDKGLIDQFNVDFSGSGSSAVVNTSISGQKEFEKGRFSFAEWRLGYKFSNIPTPTVRLEDSTVTGQFFAATKPVGSRNLFFRFGASVEGGNRHSDLSQISIPSENLADSGYKALKFYVGTTFNGKFYNWKSSYGIQLGNSGQGLRINYVKQIFDTAVKARIFPADHKLLQFDLQFTAGSIKAVSGAIPVGERFFGGNAEQEFIDGDNWRIRSNPYIRSFPQNRLNRLSPTAPIGGENFASFNLTVAQSVWNRPMVPREIARNADVVAGVGGQLLVLRRTLRDEPIYASEQTVILQTKVRAFTPAIDELKRTLQIVRETEQNLPADDLQSIDDSIQEIEDTIADALLNPPGATNTSIEIDAITLVKGFGDDSPSLLTVIKESLGTLSNSLSQNNQERINSVLTMLTNIESDAAKALSDVNELRTYKQGEIEPLIKIITEPSIISGRTMEAILDAMLSDLETIQTVVEGDLSSLDPDSSDTAIREKREKLNDFRDRLENATGYVNKSKALINSARDAFNNKDFPEAKFSVEQLTVGFGKGLRPLLVGISESIRDIKQQSLEINRDSLWSKLDQNSAELLAMQKSVKSKFNNLQVPATEKETNKLVTYVGGIFGTLTRELNIIAVSPVFMFDVTRFGTGKPINESGFRYGVGGGLRLSLVNLDFTGGYSVNPNRRFGEPVGAFVFRMDINDLFR